MYWYSTEAKNLFKPTPYEFDNAKDALVKRVMMLEEGLTDVDGWEKNVEGNNDNGDMTEWEKHMVRVKGNTETRSNTIYGVEKRQ